MELPHDHSPSIILLSPDGGNEIMRPTTVFGRAIGLLSNGKTNGSRTWFESKQNVVRVEAHDVKAGMATPRRRQGPARAGLRPYGSGVMAARKRMRG